MQLEKKELMSVVGGFNFTATFFGHIVRGVTVVYELGRAFGSSLRRIRTGNFCTFR